MQIIHIENNAPVFENRVGLKIAIYEENGKFGLGQIFLNGTSIGGCCDCFVYEDSHYCWDKYQATHYEIIENTEDTGTIRFYGTYGVENILSKWMVTIRVTSDSYAFEIDAKIGAYMWGARYHRLYISIPFENAHMECVSYPMEAPILPPYDKHWYVTPDLGKVPMMLARENIDGKPIHVGYGYTIAPDLQDYSRGGLWYDATNVQRCLRVDFPYGDQYWIPAQFTWDQMTMGFDLAADKNFSPQMPRNYDRNYFKRPPYSCLAVISVAPTQSDCVFGYMKKSGFNTDISVKHDVLALMQEMMNAYAGDDKYFYEPGKGYRMHTWANSTDRASYYDFIAFAMNCLLSHALYCYWSNHKDCTWARGRAIEMIDFCIDTYSKFGFGIRAWDLDHDTIHGIGNNFVAFGLNHDTTFGAMCAHNIEKVYRKMVDVEGSAPAHWHEAAVNYMDWIIARIHEGNGNLKAVYTAEYVGVDNAVDMAAFNALRYFYNTSHEEKYLNALTMYENYYYNTMFVNNDWYNGIQDNNTVKQPITGEQYRNYYTLPVIEAAGYFTDRYLDTKDEAYMQKAKDMLAFAWMGRMPINMPGYQHMTKGLVEEQNIWVFYDCPWPFTSPMGLLKMSRIAQNDPFYAEYFKVLLSTQMEFAFPGEIHPFFAQVLSADPHKRQPTDSFAEVIGDKTEVWITSYTSLIIDAMASSEMQFYMGGKNWGVGMDYALDFEPDFGDKPFPCACTSRLFNAAYEGNTFHAYLSGVTRNEDGVIAFNTGSSSDMPKQILINGKDITSKAYRDIYGDLSIPYPLIGELDISVTF